MNDDKLQRVNIEYGPQTGNQFKVTDENGKLVLCHNVSLEIRHGHLMAFLLGYDRVSHPHRVGLVNVVLPDGTTFVRTKEQVDDEIRRAVSGEMELYAFTIASPPSIPNANGRIYPAHDTYKFGDHKCGIAWTTETDYADGSRYSGRMWTIGSMKPFYDKQLGEPFDPTPSSKPDHDAAADAYGNRVPMAKVPVPRLPAKGWHSELVALCQSLTDGETIGVGDEPQAESVREWCRKLGRPDLNVVVK